LLYIHYQEEQKLWEERCAFLDRLLENAQKEKKSNLEETERYSETNLSNIIKMHDRWMKILHLILGTPQQVSDTAKSQLQLEHKQLPCLVTNQKIARRERFESSIKLQDSVLAFMQEKGEVIAKIYVNESLIYQQKLALLQTINDEPRKTINSMKQALIGLGELTELYRKNLPLRSKHRRRSTPADSQLKPFQGGTADPQTKSARKRGRSKSHRLSRNSLVNPPSIQSLIEQSSTDRKEQGEKTNHSRNQTPREKFKSNRGRSDPSGLIWEASSRGKHSSAKVSWFVNLSELILEGGSPDEHDSMLIKSQKEKEEKGGYSTVFEK